MTTIEKARALVRSSRLKPIALGDGTYYDFTTHRSMRTQQLDSDVLARSLSYFIELTELPGRPKLGCSVKHGQPHLPADWKFPKSWKGFRFYLQLNLAELATLDVNDCLPDEGMLYWFQHENEGTCRIHYGASKKLVVRDDIPSFEDEGMRLGFAPAFLFYAGKGDAYDYSQSYTAVPKALREKMEKLFGCKMAKSSPEERLFGRPLFWQGEDEGDEEMDEGRPRIMLLHTQMEDSNLHVWVDPQASRKGDFSKAWEDFSGT